MTEQDWRQAEQSVSDLAAKSSDVVAVQRRLTGESDSVSTELALDAGTCYTLAVAWPTSTPAALRFEHRPVDQAAQTDTPLPGEHRLSGGLDSLVFCSEYTGAVVLSIITQSPAEGSNEGKLEVAFAVGEHAKGPAPAIPPVEAVRGTGWNDCLLDVSGAIAFVGNKYELEPSALPALDEIVAILSSQANVGIPFEVGAHSDSKGSNDYNSKLTQKQAESVRDHLAGLGIRFERMTARGYGEESPIASNETAEGRQQNRRIEFRRTDVCSSGG